MFHLFSFFMVVKAPWLYDSYLIIQAQFQLERPNVSCIRKGPPEWLSRQRHQKAVPFFSVLGIKKIQTSCSTDRKAWPPYFVNVRQPLQSLGSSRTKFFEYHGIQILGASPIPTKPTEEKALQWLYGWYPWTPCTCDPTWRCGCSGARIRLKKHGRQSATLSRVPFFREKKQNKRTKNSVRGFILRS